MNHWVNFFRKRNEGSISIQVVIIGGLIIGFGAIAIESFHQTSSVQVENTVLTLDTGFNTPEIKNITNR